MVYAKKSLGQHFLHNTQICQRIVDCLQVTNEENILEIGPGTGALTHILKALPYKSFLILEKDDRFAQIHTEEANERTKVLHIDALTFPWKSLDFPIKIISNLPYNVGSPLMWDIVSQTPHLVKAVFMVQNEVANRVVALENSKEYGALGIWIQAYCHVKKEFIVAPSAFTPPPKVQSAIISFLPKKIDEKPKNPHLLSLLLKTCFQQRRKQLGTVLRNSFFKAHYEKILEQAHIKATLRPENLSVEQFILLSDLFKDI